eukprot:TRINITY_DN6435_c0_g2_i1.p1 TRINITY_DN6435_c0_g2~~TRINITY_DN6435_c0_g2_i1.p1  ORF type:complete len:345 (-),score=18.17 TRINITY_DN6435_c0_g2_i1:3631-4665(-)
MKTLPFCCLLLFTQFCIAQNSTAQPNGDDIGPRNLKSQGGINRKAAADIQEASDKCETENGCACLVEWEFQGRNVAGCSNPDEDRYGAWCQLDQRTCGNPDHQFLDTLQFYGYCTCNNLTTQGSPPQYTSVSSSIDVYQYASQSSQPPPPSLSPPPPARSEEPKAQPSREQKPLRLHAGDCLTIFNSGCTESQFYMAFADGQPLLSREYEGYVYWQTSGWWMLSKEVGDYIRWCSPTGFIGLYVQKEWVDTDLGSDIVSTYSVGSDLHCLNPDQQFDFLTYKLDINATKDGHLGTPNPDFFYMVKDAGERSPICEGIQGTLHNFQILQSNTTLYIGESCSFSEM